MSYDENRISDQIDAGIHDREWLEQELATTKRELEKVSKHRDYYKEKLNKQEEMTIDLMTVFKMSISYISIEEAKSEFPKLFASNREVAKEWYESLKSKLSSHE